jgi:hypothetical protein
MNDTKESLLVDVLLLVYVCVSGVFVWIMPILLNIAYDAGHYTFDLSLTASLLKFYGYVLLCVPLIVGIDFGKHFVTYFTRRPLDEL